MNNIKPSFDTDRQILGKILPLATPFNVVIDSSERCNFQCSYCFRGDADHKENWGYAKRNELMTWEIFQKVVAQIKEFPEEVKQISLSNHGEPLCNPMISQMAAYIKQQGIKSRVSIHTNASLLNEKIAMELARANIDKVVISLQGLTVEKYKKVCNVSIDFEKLCRNIEILYKNKTNTQVFVKIMDIALDDGEEEAFLNLFSNIADRVFIETEVPIWKKDSEDEKKNISYNKYGKGFPAQECCPLIFHTIVVAPNGDVYPCTQLLREDILGNINNASLVALWNGLQRKKLLIQQCNKDNPEICNGCFIRQNSIYAQEDMIDSYRLEIKERL